MARSLLLAALFPLLACNAHSSAEPDRQQPGTAAREAPNPTDGEPPLLQLPQDVRPIRYALSLQVNPDQDSFSGTVEIAVEFDRPRRIVWLHGKGLHVTAASAGDGPAHYQQVNDDGLARLQFDRPIGPGIITLHLAWEAAYEPKLVGLYLAHEAGLNYAFTMFEPADARRMFPGFDEPAFKTPFQLTLTVPSGDTAIANTNPLKEEQLPGGFKRIVFLPTAPLPTYLLALAVGPLDILAPPPLPPNEVRSRPLQIRGIAPRGRAKELSFALQAGGELLVILERYFGIPFPYEKLDHLAVPDFAYGAEENAGAIMYRESALLFTEGTSPEELKSRIGGIMAHEMAHQWFGDLVTMRWWDDTWLNESFATWMGSRAEDQWRPDYLTSVQLLKAVQFAMNNDSLASARAIRQPLERMKDVWNQFDGITYQKGGGTLAMFERYLGAEKFRKGVSSYLTAHANGSGSTDDLLAAFSRASGKDVTQAFHSFLDQSGVPLVEARTVCDANGARLELKQSRFLPLGTPALEADRARLWQIPICARYGTGTAAGAKESCMLLTTPEGSLPLEACPAWLIPNAEGAGYYRWSLAPADLQKLATAGYRNLSLRERVSLVASLTTALSAGKLQEKDGLAALEPMARDEDGTVAVEPLDVLAYARDYLVRDDLRPAVDQVAQALYAKTAAKLGWEPRRDEPLETRRLRRRLLDFLAFEVEDRTVLEAAARRGRAYAALAGSTFDVKAVAPDLAETALRAAVQAGDSRFFDGLVARLGQTDDGEARGRILVALGSTRDPKLADRALALSLDPRLRTNERTVTLRALEADRRTREQAFTWLLSNFDALLARIPETNAQALPQLALAFCDQEHLERAQAFFGPRAEKIPAMPRSLAQTLEAGRICLAYRAAQSQSANEFFAPRQ